MMSFSLLVPYGWGDRWVALLADHPGCTPARVTRHDGTSLVLATPDGVRQVELTHRLDPPPTVGDWLAYDDSGPVAVLPRSSLLRRQTATGDGEQLLAANIDVVLLVCGLDRPVKRGRLQRSATLAWDAGAIPVIVLTKSVLAPDPDAVAADAEEAMPGLDVLLTSPLEGIGLDELRAVVRDRTVTMLGESGAGKSSLLNALVGDEVAATRAVRRGDARGRHTTTARQLHVLPGGGVLIDTPGIRSVGLAVDPDALSMTFSEIDELGEGCRFGDCRHEGEPGCAVTAAVESGAMAADRFEAWRSLRRESEAAALRANPHEMRRRNKQFGRVVKEAKQLKRR
jgi:ribosome biogenesis GTPase